MGKDHTLFALEPGFVRFYASPSPFPHRESPSPSSSTSTSAAAPAPPVKRPRTSRQYIGIVAERGGALPRQQDAEGRERRFWGAVRAREGPAGGEVRDGHKEREEGAQAGL